MADWKKPNTKRAGKPSGKSFSNKFGTQSQKPNVKYTYTVELDDAEPVEKTREMFIGKIESKGEHGILTIVNRKVRFDAVDMKEAAKATNFDFTLKTASQLEDGEWKVIYEEQTDEAPDDADDRSDGMDDGSASDVVSED